MNLLRRWHYRISLWAQFHASGSHQKAGFSFVLSLLFLYNRRIFKSTNPSQLTFWFEARQAPCLQSAAGLTTVITRQLDTYNLITANMSFSQSHNETFTLRFIACLSSYGRVRLFISFLQRTIWKSCIVLVFRLTVLNLHEILLGWNLAGVSAIQTAIVTGPLANDRYR